MVNYSTITYIRFAQVLPGMAPANRSQPSRTQTAADGGSR
jgi:hypothetical protein